MAPRRPPEREADHRLLHGLLLSPYHSRSQEQWAGQLTGGIREIGGLPISWRILALPPRHFALRLRGAPLSLWDELRNADIPAPDFIIATSTVDLAALLGCAPELRRIPSLLYFHENQFAYPQGEGRSREYRRDFQISQLYSALTADRLAFNSRWNRDSFLAGVSALLNSLPEPMSPNILAHLEAKSQVIYVPVESPHRDLPAAAWGFGGAEDGKKNVPHFIWPHRWEYDKGPEVLLEFCRILGQERRDFRISLLGQRFRSIPQAMRLILREFSQQILRREPIADRGEYLDYLCASAGHPPAWVISTADHEFFGIAVAEGVLAGLKPLVPDGLSYRELIGDQWRYEWRATDGPRQRAESMYLKWRELAGDEAAAGTAASADALLIDPLPGTVLPEYQRLLREFLSPDFRCHPAHRG
jgi:glycosyltransferase involved in cell wall biosynthesis